METAGARVRLHRLAEFSSLTPDDGGMTGMKRRFGALIVCMLLAGCGGGDNAGASDKATTQPPTETTTPTPEPEPVTMLEACPEVEAALPSAFIPGATKMGTFVARLEELSREGDTETQNALALLIPAAEDLEIAVLVDAQGSELLDPLMAHTDGISAFADRCKAAGSSALQ